MKHFTALACAFCLIALTATAGAARDPIPVDIEKKLQVIIHDNIAPRQRDSWTGPRMERDRYLEMETAVERAMKAAGYAGPVKVEQFAANLPDVEQRLHLYLYRWETGLETFGASFSAEFAMEAVLQVGDREYDLGTFSARESHMALGGFQPEDYQPVARRAVDQMIEYYRNAISKSQPKK